MKLIQEYFGGGSTMKKLMTLLLIALMLSGCGGSNKGEPERNSLTFTAYLKASEAFEFTLDPKEALTFQQLRDGIKETDVDGSNWRSYFDIKEVYREHYEYDDQGNRSDTYAAGKMIVTVLNDEYIYVDNWSRNGLEWEVFVEGQQTMTMTNEGKIGSPAVSDYLGPENYSGADAILILTDFTDSWDKLTSQKYEGYLKSYDMISCSGHLKLLDSSLIKFRHLKDNIYYFIAYESDENFAVIFVESENGEINREDEYNAIIYEKEPGREIERGYGGINVPIWQVYIELMSKVEE